MTVNTKAPTIRGATRDDLPTIEALLRANDLPIAGVRDAICSLLVADVDSRIVGVVGMERHGRYGLLRSTAVTPEWRGRGVARQLVERIIADAESQGVNAMYLLTTTAERYFPSFGFAATARNAVPDEIQQTGEFREACPASATVMCLALQDRN
ncbi:MAG TPA: arsenic resistance N-acetyltransferase ArsN2 [Gemmatimonadaceae bacterium]|nr:arsenic resistance N-acetyltransferase ArsN2 [Gemmatimonadaceae bacterium]